ncbi:MAG: D-aminoacyl-tRNA deacylase [Candidatus Diapherotrites archaeon]
MYAIIVSTVDTAGLAIKKQLLGNFDFKETDKQYKNNEIYTFENFNLYTINDLQIYADYLDELGEEILIFASRHSSEKGTPSLTTHCIGNWGNTAEMGGKPRTLVPAVPSLVKNYLVGLQKQKEKNSLNYEVIAEVTHHGAFLTKPSIYIEVGSSETEWTDENAALAIAETIMHETNILETNIHETKIGNYKTAIGIGGPHYHKEFTKLMLKTNYAIGHICPKYALENFDEVMLQKAIKSSLEPVQEIVLDYKGLGTEKERIMRIVEECKLPVKRIRQISE